MSAARPILEVRGLRVEYRGPGGTPLRAVDGVDLSIAAGECVGLVGESGSGKSSLARALLKLVPAAGSVLFEGEDILCVPEERLRLLRPGMQLVFQDPLGALDPRMTVLQAVAEPLRLREPGAKAVALRAAVETMLGQVGLAPGLLGLYPRQLSGGQAQRVAIARALIAAPRLLVCDEPLAALDVSVKAQVANLLAGLRRRLGLSLLVIAHELPLVRFLCERVAVLHRGRIVEAGTREAVFAAPLHPYTRQLVAASTASPGGETAAPPAHIAAPAGGCGFRLRCPHATALCADSEPALAAFGGREVACHRAAEL